ncbi:MAG: carbohydrate kinase family protein [Candidatus Dojkabacteria bacterium]
MSNKALIVGSVVYDVIFAIHGNIKNELHIKEGEIQKISMMFTAKNKERYFGGTAGNIAYGLGLLGGNPILHGVVGDDFLHDYKDHLEKHNVELRLKVQKGAYTSTFYGISDEEYQQIGIFQPNVYYDFIENLKLEDTLKENDFNSIKYAIFSPGNGESTRNHMVELRNKLGKDVSIIFDPSQVLSILYKPDILKECLSHSDIFIGNDTEVNQLKTLFGYSIKDLLDLGLSYIIETRGADGSVVFSKDGEINVDAVKPTKVVETTGAGDAFRSGLLYGLLNNKTVEESCKIGAYMGARNVEEYGGQLYKINKKDLKF